MTDQNQQHNQNEDMPMWARTLLDKVSAIEAQQAQMETDRQNRIAQANQPKEKQYIQLPFGQVEDTPANRALIKTDTSHLTNFDPIAEMQKDKANDHMWERVRAAHAAFMAEQDQNRVLTPDEQAAKDASKTRAKEAIGSRMRVFGSDDAFWK